MDVADVVERLEQADAAHIVLFAPYHNELAPCILVVVVHRIDNFIEPEVELAERPGVDDDLVLEHIAPHRKDIGHAAHGLQLVFDDPVVDFAEIGVRILALGVGARLEREVVQEDLAEAGGDRPQLRRLVQRGQVGRGLVQPLGHDLARKIHVDVVVEVDIDHRQSAARG